MKSMMLVAFFGFVCFGLLAVFGCEDHVREENLRYELDSAVEVEVDEDVNFDFDANNDVDVDFDEEVETDIDVDSINVDDSVEAVDGDDNEEVAQACDLFAMRTASSPVAQVVPINARGLDLLELRIAAREQVGILALVFEQFAPSGPSNGPLRLVSREWSVSQEAEITGRLATFVFEQEVLTIKDGYIHFMLEIDLNGSMRSGDVFGYRLIDVITTDGGCVDGLPVESNLMSVSSLCAWILSQNVDLLQIFGSTYECESDIEVREMNFSIENLTGATIENFRLLNHSDELIAGPVELELGSNSFGLNEPFLVSAQSLYLIKIRFDAEPGEVNILLDSVIVYDFDRGTETVPWGDFPFVWNYTSE